jgi:hypothetical protein
MESFAFAKYFSEINTLADLQFATVWMAVGVMTISTAVTVRDDLGREAMTVTNSIRSRRARTCRLRGMPRSVDDAARTELTQINEDCANLSQSQGEQIIDEKASPCFMPSSILTGTHVYTIDFDLTWGDCQRAISVSVDAKIMKCVRDQEI